MKAIEVAGLSYFYRSRSGVREALRGIDFSVDQGEIFGLMGPNGGGKSTLFGVLATLLEPGRGTARVMGHDLVQEAAQARRLLGIVFQSPSLAPKLTVRENLRLQGYLYGLSGAALSAKIHDLLISFNLEDRVRDLAGILSGGLQRRLEIAKALLHDPAVLLMDEPTAGLDPAARHIFWDVIQRLRANRGCTILLTSHLSSDAEQCDRLGLLDQGRLVAVGSPASLKGEIGADIVSIAADDPEPLAQAIEEKFALKTQRLNGALRIESRQGHLLIPQLAETFAGSIRSINLSKPTIDDVFIKKTGRHLE